MKKKLTLTVGIPVFNEEKNICQLIEVLLLQKQEGFKLEEIIVVSDGSYDSTCELVKSINNPLITLIEGRTRLGQQARQNQLLQLFRGDLLAIIEGDILPVSDKTLSELVKPFYDSNISNLGMVIGRPVPLKPKKFYERVLYHGLLVKLKLFSTWKKGLNVYTSGGHSMKVISRAFSKKLEWPINVPEDAYTYFRLKQLGFSMARNPKAQAYMRNVGSFSDRKRQVKKFLSGKKALEKYFPKEILDSEYKIPPLLAARSLISNFAENPFWTVLFFAEIIANRLAVLRRSAFSAVHEIYGSSKELVSGPGAVDLNATVSVGIPAYNEEANIGLLIDRILKQKLVHGKLLEIIIVSDGSDDGTVQICRSKKDSRIKVIENNIRLGVEKAQNQITKAAKGDILVILDGDVLPVKRDFLDNLILPILSDPNVGLVGANTVSARPVTFFEKIISDSHYFKNKMYLRMSGGDNLYLCHGRARAFSKKFYKLIVWPTLLPEDSFSYLFARKKGFKFVFSENARVIFRSPSNIADHFKQSQRFMGGRELLIKKFGKKESVISAFRIGISDRVRMVASFLLSSPVSFLGYSLVFWYGEIFAKRRFANKTGWEIAQSSKRVVI